MLTSCVSFCTVALFSLCIKNLYAQEVNISSTTQLPIHTKPNTSDVYQTDGFNSSSLQSGPVLVVDKRTLFISNLHYDGKNEGRFWVGAGQPSENGEIVPDENNSTGPLRSYNGANIYLQLMGNLTTDKIDYVAVWSTEKKTDLGRVMLYKNVSYEIRNNVPEALGYHNKTKDHKTILRIPACCGKKEVYDEINRLCVPTETDLDLDLPVLESNETHIDPERNMSDTELVLYNYNLKCKTGYGRFTLSPEDKPYLIYNGTLTYYMDPEYHGILPHGSFCVISVNATPYAYLICIEIPPDTAGMSPTLIYFIFLIISAICFFVSAMIYIFFLKDRDIHRKCFVGYSGSMTVTFVALICLQFINQGCNFMGGLFMFSLTCSFVWLTCLCVDLIFVIKEINKCPEDKTRIHIYIACSLGIPAVCLLGSLIPNGIPDVPRSFVKQYSESALCEYKDTDVKAFFIPIGLLILASVCSLAYASYLINTIKVGQNYDFKRKKQNRFMLRSCVLVWITTCIWLLLEAVLSLVKMIGVIRFALELIEALQGIFVIIIFVLNKYIRKEIINVLREKEIKENQNMRYQNLLTSLQKRRRGTAETANL